MFSCIARVQKRLKTEFTLRKPRGIMKMKEQENKRGEGQMAKDTQKKAALFGGMLSENPDFARLFMENMAFEG